MKVIILSFIVLNCFAANTKKLVKGLGIPWGIEVVDNYLLATQKNGKVLIYDFKTKFKKNINFPISIHDRSQGGLLDIEKSPNFQKDRTLYFSYAKATSKGATTALAKGTFKNGVLKGIKEIFEANAYSGRNIHFGSRITFDDKGYLFLSVGDRGNRDEAQNLKVHNGKILRLTLDGKIPKDNPFKSAVWSYGHRNPQGLKWNAELKKLIEVEHGPRGGDEINIIEKGKNYGWPIVSQGREYISFLPVGVKKKKGMIDPVRFYVPSIAPCGLDFYKGKFLIGALAKTHLNVVEFNQDYKKIKEVRLLEDQEWRVRDIHVSQGKVFISTDRGEIHQVLDI